MVRAPDKASQQFPKNQGVVICVVFKTSHLVSRASRPSTLCDYRNLRCYPEQSRRALACTELVEVKTARFSQFNTTILTTPRTTMPPHNIELRYNTIREKDFLAQRISRRVISTIANNPSDPLSIIFSI